MPPILLHSLGVDFPPKRFGTEPSAGIYGWGDGLVGERRRTHTQSVQPLARAPNSCLIGKTVNASSLQPGFEELYMALP